MSKSKTKLETIEDLDGILKQVGRVQTDDGNESELIYRHTHDVGALESGYSARNLADRVSAVGEEFGALIAGGATDGGGRPSLELLPPFRQVAEPKAGGVRTRIEITVRVYNEHADDQRK